MITKTKADGFLISNNQFTGVRTIQKINQRSFGYGEITVIITNCNHVFMRPIIEWFEEAKHVDLEAYKKVCNKKKKNSKEIKYLLTLNEPKTLLSWMKKRIAS